MSGWKVAGSLDELLAQINALAPDRSRASDGSIGDEAHASRDSDHNPWWEIAGQAYVTARDYTHDPAGGLNAHLLADSLQQAKDQRVKYAIWNRRIMSGSGGPDPWEWRPYGGTNPHTKHLHLSVVADARALVRIPWQLPTLLAAPAPPRPLPLPEEDDVSWTKAEGAPVVPDLYEHAPQGQVLTDPLWALANATAHAAHARDRATEARDAIAFLAESMRVLAARVEEISARPAAAADPQAFAAAVAADLARRLQAS